MIWIPIALVLITAFIVGLRLHEIHNALDELERRVEKHHETLKLLIEHAEYSDKDLDKVLDRTRRTTP